MKKRLTYIISDINKALPFEWVATALSEAGYRLDFILLNPGDSVLEQFLKEHGIAVTRIRCAGKKDWPQAWWKTYRHLRKTKPEVVHCHLLQANIIGLSAAKAAGIHTRIYTRHHSSQHHVYHPKGVLWDKMVSRQATHIIAISENVKTILTEWERVPANKIHLIPHGFLLDSFRYVADKRVEAIRAKYDIISRHPVVGVIARFTELKGVQYIIPAFKQLLYTHPDAVLLLFNGQGDYEDVIRSSLSALPDRNYRIIPFEPEITAALKVMDIFIHVPIDEHSEAFGQIYVEALAAGIPSVFTLSGIAPDFIRDQENALVVPFKDTQAIYDQVVRLLSDDSLRREIIHNGRESVKDRFELSRMIMQLEQLYTSKQERQL